MDKYLMTGEETYKLLAGCGEINCLFKVKSNCTPCARMMKAQHLKSVKAVLDELEKTCWHDGFPTKRFCPECYVTIKNELLENFDKLEGK